MPHCFGRFGGQYVAPPLLPVLDRLDAALADALADPAFMREWRDLLARFIGRPTPLLELAAPRARLFFKREDLTSTGGNYVNAALGQCLLARRMGFDHVLTDTGSGDNGVATASVAAQLGLACTVFMAADDVATLPSAVREMRAYGARVVAASGATLHAAMSAAFRFWMGADAFYVAGAPIGPHPYPAMVRAFQTVIGEEVAIQLGRVPDVLVAPLGGGSGALGLFLPFAGSSARCLVAEGGGTGPGHDAARLGRGRPGILHGARTLVLQDDDGQLAATHTIAAGLAYPGVAPELAAMFEAGRVETVAVTDADALDAQRRTARASGILVSIESAHAVAAAEVLAAELVRDATVVVLVTSGGAKDLERVEARA